MFPDASEINAYLGMTQRSGEDDWLLMGMALLKTHRCGGIKYRHYGFFAQHDGADEGSWLPVPLDSSDPKDADFIVEALEDFDLKRLETPGLSVVVPFPKPELTPAAIEHAVLTQYFLPIVRGDLVVEITHPEDGTRTVDHTSILKVADQVTPPEQDNLSERPDESPDSLRRAIEFARWAIERKNDEHLVLEAPGRTRREKIELHLAALRERYEQGERLAIRLTTTVRSKTGAAQPTCFRVYLERADDLAEGHDYFVRGHLRIPHMDHIRRFKARALVLVDGKSDLGHLLRDAEGPAHDRWDRGSARLKQRWQGGQDRVDEVRRAPAHILRHLVERPNGKQMDALADLFPGDPAQVGKGRGGKRGGTLARPDSPAPQPPAYLQVDSPVGAFVVRPTKNGEESGLANREWDLRFAYDTVRGNPFGAFETGFRQGSPDFSLGGDTLAIEADGCKYEPTGPNTLRFTAIQDVFRLRISGFDDRDVKVAVEEVLRNPGAQGSRRPSGGRSSVIKRINRTGRKRILKRDIQLKLRATENQDAPIFDLDLRLVGYGFPESARVRAEAWRGHAVQRWDCGTVGDLQQPSEDRRRLTDVPPSARFRVFVVAADGSGKLLGHASNLTPELPLNSRLPLEERDLGEVVWRVEFDGEDGNPVLLVNQKVAGISEAVRHDPTFRSLVMPEVFRSILTRMVLIDRAYPDDTDGPWADWFELARAYLPTKEPPSRPTDGVDTSETGDAHDAHQWIDAVVGALADKPLNAATAFGKAL